MLYGVLDDVGGRLQAEFFEDVRAVRLHGADADDKAFGDLLIADSLGDQNQHLALAIGEARIIAWRRVGLDAIQVIANHFFRARGIEYCCAARARAHRRKQILGRGFFENIARRAGLERAEKILVAFVHREDEHLGLRGFDFEEPGGIETVQIGHRDVEDRDIG